MRILITNDDGIYSPGIAALAKVASQFGEVRIVAPDVEQSSMGHAVTHSRPLSYRTSPKAFDGLDAYRVNGTPADCVAIGTHLWSQTDVVLSGDQYGPESGEFNGGIPGTLAAAKQAVLLGIKGIALSTPVGKTEPDFDRLAPYVEEALTLLLAEPGLALYNVNFPENPAGIRWTRQSVRLLRRYCCPGRRPAGP